MNTSQGIMVPEHPRWSEFLSKLSRARICYGTSEQARATLVSMGGIDVERSLLELARLGATCDCQIELDVAPRSAGVRA